MTATPFSRTVTAGDGEDVLVLSGEIDWSNAGEALADPGRTDAPAAAAGAPPRRLVLDLRDVSYFDSAALGALFRLHGAVAAEGGSVRVVVAAGSPLPTLFEISQIGLLMPVSEV